jgi:hypothetical protein
MDTGIIRQLLWLTTCSLGIVGLWTSHLSAQLTDQTQTPNAAGRGIALSLEQQVGAGQGDEYTPDSSIYFIQRDPARAIRRGRQLFQRKFTMAQGFGPRKSDGGGDIAAEAIIGAGLVDSCAGCHGRPRGAAGHGGDVVTRPDSRDAPHLFGLGLQEMIADEITKDLRDIRAHAIASARRNRTRVTRSLRSKEISYGRITARPDGSVDTSEVQGVDPDLRVRPFFAHGGTISIREFVVGAFKAEMGLEAFDLCLSQAAQGGECVTPSGMALDGGQDKIEAPPISSVTEDGDGDGIKNEMDVALIDFMEFYLLNYFKAGLGQQTETTRRGFELIEEIGCTTCHIRDLVIEHDRRVADVETRFDQRRGIFNRLFAEATPLFVEEDDGQSLPKLVPAGQGFVVKNIFADFKRHDLGPNFRELNYDGTYQKTFMTASGFSPSQASPLERQR